jgi:hypothetical protein
VPGLEGVAALALNQNHSLALKEDGTVWVWGRNTHGNLGQGPADNRHHPTPTPVPGLTDVVDIATGRDHVLALHAGVQPDGNLSLERRSEFLVGEAFFETDWFPAPDARTDREGLRPSSTPSLAWRATRAGAGGRPRGLASPRARCWCG